MLSSDSRHVSLPPIRTLLNDQLADPHPPPSSASSSASIRRSWHPSPVDRDESEASSSSSALLHSNSLPRRPLVPAHLMDMRDSILAKQHQRPKGRERDRDRRRLHRVCLSKGCEGTLPNLSTSPGASSSSPSSTCSPYREYMNQQPTSQVGQYDLWARRPSLSSLSQSSQGAESHSSTQWEPEALSPTATTHSNPTLFSSPLARGYNPSSSNQRAASWVSQFGLATSVTPANGTYPTGRSHTHSHTHTSPLASPISSSGSMSGSGVSNSNTPFVFPGPLDTNPRSRPPTRPASQAQNRESSIDGYSHLHSNMDTYSSSAISTGIPTSATRKQGMRQDTAETIRAPVSSERGHYPSSQLTSMPSRSYTPTHAYSFSSSGSIPSSSSSSSGSQSKATSEGYNYEEDCTPLYDDPDILEECDDTVTSQNENEKQEGKEKTPNESLEGRKQKKACPFGRAKSGVVGKGKKLWEMSLFSK